MEHTEWPPTERDLLWLSIDMKYLKDNNNATESRETSRSY